MRKSCWLALFAILSSFLLPVILLPQVLVLAAEPAATTRPATQPAAEDEYSVVLMNGKKIGYAQSTRAVTGGKVTTTETVDLTISRGPVKMNVSTIEKCVETTDGKPLSFQSVQNLGAMTTTVEGAVAPTGMWKVKTSGVGAAREQEMEWPPGAMLTEGLRLYSLEKGIKEGTAYTATIFETSSLRAMEANILVGPTAEVDLLGRVVKLTEVTATLAGPMGRMTVVTYVNDKQEALKTIMPMMGMQLEILACTKEVALSPDDVSDFFDRFLLASPAPLPDVKTAKAVRYTLRPLDANRAAEWFKSIPATDEQELAAAGGAMGAVVTVRPLARAAGEKFPYAGADANLLAATKPAKYLQSDDKRVAALAKEAVGDAADSAQAVERIEKFVAKYINKKDLSVGYASAAEVAESRQGDCTEHAVLAAAMCRAAGIPAQVVVGMAYVPEFQGRKDVFGPHAWARAWAGGKWVSLDAALGGFDAGHIALACGNGAPFDFFSMVHVLGNLEIVEAKVTK